MEEKLELLALTPKELEQLLVSLGEPKYRAVQIFPQLHKGLSPEEMTNIGKVTRAKLAEATDYHLPGVKRKLVSALDGTVKYLFELADGNCVESVVMEYEHGNTICISTQVGCNMGCKFCASTIGGKVRNLTPGELLGQVIAAGRDSGKQIGGIVMTLVDGRTNLAKEISLCKLPKPISLRINLGLCLDWQVRVLAKMLDGQMHQPYMIWKEYLIPLMSLLVNWEWRCLCLILLILEIR